MTRSPAPALADLSWTAAKPLKAVMAALGARGEARYVGGCVRDSLAGRPVNDIDVATTLTPEEVMAVLKDAGIKAIPTGIEHGTVTAVADHQPVEITTLREDVETDGRRAVVAFTTDWRKDASRRDFTINALSLDQDGGLHDYFGGLTDLEAGRVRFIGRAEDRIREDYLRILRFFRFQARYGKGAPDAEGLKACAALKDGLTQLSAERVWSELKRLLETPHVSPLIDVMRETGVLAVILPESARADPRLLLALEQLEKLLGERSALRRLAAIAPTGDKEGARALARRLRLSNEETKRLAAIEDISEWHPGATIKDLRARLYRQGKALGLEVLVLAMARGALELPEKAHEPFLSSVKDSYDALHRWEPPAFPLDGKDVAALGVPQGPKTGELLRAVEDWWIGEDFEPDREACLARLGALAP